MSNNHVKTDSFGHEHARNYDKNNKHLAPLHENLHYLISILLGRAEPAARVLCVGVGTGTEIIALAQQFPFMSFVAVDPSESMIQVCNERLKSAGIAERCQLIHGYIQDVPTLQDFNAALCLLVLHHTTNTERKSILEGVFKHLVAGGIFILSELSQDVSSASYKDEMENWQALSRKAGSAEEKIQALPAMLKQHLHILAPTEIENLIERSGFNKPIPFFQSFLIRAWYARKGL